MKKKFEITLLFSILWALLIIGVIIALNLAGFFQAEFPSWLNIAVPVILVAVALTPGFLVIYAHLMNKQRFITSLLIVTLVTAAYIFYPVLINQSRSNSFAVVFLLLFVLWMDRKVWRPQG